MGYKVSFSHTADSMKVSVIGCGGTGSLVADGICRLLQNKDIDLLLVDMDRVEPHNLRRQSFFEADIGKFKSQVLAERLARQYGRRIGYRVWPFCEEVMSEPTEIGRSVNSGVIIGCVDNAAARRDIAKSLQIGSGQWWLDAGNSEHSGQVLFGNARHTDYLEQAFDAKDKTVARLPAPSLQLPSLLAPSKELVRHRDCAEAVEADEQSPVINQAMAVLVLEFMRRMLKGEMDIMGAYIDLSAGTLRYVDNEPETVARMLSVKVDYLMKKRRKEDKELAEAVTFH